MTVWRKLARGSLALRLVAMFTLGGFAVFLIVGLGLAFLLRMELHERDRIEIDSKTFAIQHHLLDVRVAADLALTLPRFVDTAVGHDKLQLGLMFGERWLLRPDAGLGQALTPRAVAAIPADEAFAMLRIGERAWWVRRVSRELEEVPARTVHALIAIEVSDTLRVLERFNVALAMIGAVGVFVIALYSWWATRRGLAPLERLADDAQRVTAQRLGEPLSTSEAPEEVRGVVAGINQMMARLADSFHSLEQFSADIAHELRTPLNSLMLRVEVTLSRERSGEEYREALQETMQELGQLQKMVSDMLFIARAERGMATLSTDRVDLRSEVDDLAEYFEPLATERDVTVSVDGTAVIEGDRGMTRRVITNLLSNAVRYSLPRSTVEIRLASDAAATRLLIRNRCEPMSQAQAEHLFDRFARGDSARTQQPEGAGLGLAIVRSVMAAHRGSARARASTDRLEIELTWPTPHQSTSAA